MCAPATMRYGAFLLLSKIVAALKTKSKKER